MRRFVGEVIRNQTTSLNSWKHYTVDCGKLHDSYLSFGLNDRNESLRTGVLHGAGLVQLFVRNTPGYSLKVCYNLPVPFPSARISARNNFLNNAPG